MAAGDTLRRIGPHDQLILNAAGQVVGIKNPNANGGDLYFDPNAVALAAGTIGSAVRIGPSMNDYGPSNPMYVAHRGAAALYPEESSVAYSRCVTDGEILLEGDVQTLSDGSLGMMHDATVDRTTSSTGNVNSFSSTTFQALNLDASVWLGSNYGDTAVHPIMFQSYIDAYKSSAILVAEDKDTLSMTALVRALINSGVAKDRAFVQCFTAANLATPVAAGYPTCGLTSAGNPSASAIAATGATWAAVNYGDSLTSYIAAGLKTMVYTVNRRYQRDLMLAQGASGFFSDDPAYLRGNTARSTTDFFSYQTWVPGMLAYSDDAGLSLPYRGTFSAPNYWGYGGTTGFYSCLQGYLSPVANPQSFTFKLKVTFDAVADASRWAGVFISTNDYPFADGTQPITGYHFLLRINGTLGIYRYDSGQAGALLSQVTGSTISTGVETIYRITVTPTALTLAQLDGSGNVVNSVSVSDSTYRGGYIHLSRNQAACRFRTLVVA